jgi:hypothetical protein
MSCTHQHNFRPLIFLQRRQTCFKKYLKRSCFAWLGKRDACWTVAAYRAHFAFVVVDKPSGSNAAGTRDRVVSVQSYLASGFFNKEQTKKHEEQGFYGRM